MKVCKNCNTENYNDQAIFCEYCGNKINESVEIQEPARKLKNKFTRVVNLYIISVFVYAIAIMLYFKFNNFKIIFILLSIVFFGIYTLIVKFRKPVKETFIELYLNIYNDFFAQYKGASMLIKILILFYFLSLFFLIF